MNIPKDLQFPSTFCACFQKNCFWKFNISSNNVISLQATKVLQYNIFQTLELHGAPMKNCAMKPITYPLSQLCVLFSYH
jgi:hypothetical protein